MNKKRIIIIVIILCLWLIAFTTDFVRAKSDKNPIFCLDVDSYSDGGTVIYLGVGYKIIAFNRFVDCGSVYGHRILSARYYYVGTWFADMDNTWEKVKDKAIQKSREQFKQYMEENPHEILDYNDV